MTDNEIIKALECCIKHNSCEKCPMHTMNCTAIVPMAFALDLIKRQQAEIERMKKYNTDVARKHYFDGINDFVNKLKTWHSYDKYDVAGHKCKQIVISEVGLNNLVNERVGDSDARDTI